MTRRYSPHQIGLLARGSAALTLAAFVIALLLNAASTAAQISGIPGSPFPAGNLPSSVIVSQDGAHVYSSNVFTDNVGAYARNAATGVI
ncbi:MAG: lactonase family protein, partial [Chloroflexi bacterium]|nr:lactonase family protein [Chloroflexota bacterium]